MGLCRPWVTRTRIVKDGFNMVAVSYHTRQDTDGYLRRVSSNTHAQAQYP